jgi:D-2-hydroxyacid dehydrogenase (NADP+)
MNVLVYTAWPVHFWNIPESHVARLRERFPEVAFKHVSSETEALAAIDESDAALASRLSTVMVQRAVRLRWVHSTASAVGALPIRDLALRGIVVTNSRGIQAVPIAETAIGGLLVISRRLNRTLAAQRERRWIQNQLSEESPPWSLQGRNMTIIGLGTIGQEIARRAHAFGLRVTGVRRRMSAPYPPFVDRVLGLDQWRDGLRGCDVLAISAPFVAETDRLIGANEISLLNRGAILINVARARIVDQNALIEALGDGHVGGAVLDVFEREPLDPESPIWTLPNVVITPHSSGFRPDHWDDVVDLFSSNLYRFQHGEPLANLVNLEAGY